MPYLCHAEQQRRAQGYLALIAAQQALARQPGWIQFTLKHRMEVLENRHGAARANRWLTAVFARRLLPRLEQVHQQYRIDTLQRGTASLLAGSGDARAAGTLWELVRRFNRLPEMSRADVDLLAGDIAHFIFAEQAQMHTQCRDESDYRYTHRLYMLAATITRELRQSAPLWHTVTSRLFDPEAIAPAILRMQSTKWWQRQLRRMAAAWREHLHIALGNVCKQKTAYVSPLALTEWREQKRRTREFLKGLELEDECGNRISLIDKHDGSIANPAIRRCELMTRLRGFETLCTELGFVGDLFTITAPSAWHATLSSGYANRRWNGASPADTQRYLCQLWQKIRARLQRENLRVFGLRVAEPHHDATPHWHLLLFMPPHQREPVRAVLREYALQQESDELSSAQAQQARLHVTAIDAAKGSATGYLAKYIAKNIDGYATDAEQDHESGKPLREMAAAVSAWAARWHIRQFQFVGGAPVTVYRELRRLADSDSVRGLDADFAAAHQAADRGDWAGYVQAQGGVLVRRQDLVVRNWYQADNTLNAYGEVQQRIKGVYATAVGADTPILTRLIVWKIVPKRVAAPAPWSSVNNCTPIVACRDLPQLDRRQRRRLLVQMRARQRPLPQRLFRSAAQDELYRAKPQMPPPAY